MDNKTKQSVAAALVKAARELEREYVVRRYLFDGEPTSYDELASANEDDEDFIAWLDSLEVGDKERWGLPEGFPGGGAASFDIERLPDVLLSSAKLERPQPGESSGEPPKFKEGAEPLKEEHLTVGQLLHKHPDIPYYKYVVADYDQKYHGWEVTQKVLEYANYLLKHPETFKELPPVIFVDGTIKDGAHRTSTLWLLTQRLDPEGKVADWKNAKLRVQYWDSKDLATESSSVKLKASVAADARNVSEAIKNTHSGVDRMGGGCFAWAVAIRRVLLPDGHLVAAVNKAIFDDDKSMVGHAAVVLGDPDSPSSVWFDSEGETDRDRVESWGMLDDSESTWEEYGSPGRLEDWATAAYEADILIFDDEDEFLSYLPASVRTDADLVEQDLRKAVKALKHGR